MLNHRVSVADVIGNGYKVNICDPQLIDLMIKLKPEVVYHLAADNRVTGLVQDTLQSNVIGTFNVLEACRRAKIKRFIFTSSAAVYGESKQLPIAETWPTRPISAYGISKLTDELYTHLFAKHFNSTIFRFANVYGPGQKSNNEGGVVAIFTKRILANQPLTVYGSGKQTRDFVYVSDVVDALIAALGRNQPGLFNIGSGKSCSVNDLVKLLVKLTGRSAKVNYRSERPREISKSLFSFQKAQKELSWQPKISLEEGLDETINSNLAGTK